MVRAIGAGHPDADPIDLGLTAARLYADRIAQEVDQKARGALKLLVQRLNKIPQEAGMGREVVEAE